MNLRSLRAHAVARSLRPAASVAEAVGAMRFVQLDPIRAPARAADLILRQRVAGYRAGDLDRAYQASGLAEDYVHVYGVMPESTRALLHPRRTTYRFHVEEAHPRLSARVLAHVERHGETHPRDLAQLGRHRVVNAWGGNSTATTRVLEALHFRGKLRVVRRAKGTKVYALAQATASSQTAAARARAVLHLLLDLYAPLPEVSFRQLAKMITESSVSESLRARSIEALLGDPAVERFAVDGLAWVTPAHEEKHSETDGRVRLLAPFDPVVWDRRRFALLWGWDYRLEAYTPPAKRQFGYYALPLLWRDEVVGWANASVLDGMLTIAVGYVRSTPRGAPFRRELEAEADRLRECVGATRIELR